MKWNSLWTGIMDRATKIKLLLKYSKVVSVVIVWWNIGIYYVNQMVCHNILMNHICTYYYWCCSCLFMHCHAYILLLWYSAANTHTCPASGHRKCMGSVEVAEKQRVGIVLHHHFYSQASVAVLPITHTAGVLAESERKRCLWPIVLNMPFG